MKIKGIHLFFILIAALILCSCLGGNNILEGYSPYGHPKKPTGGCEGTQYGCCPDGTTAKNSDGSNCNQPQPQPQPQPPPPPPQPLPPRPREGAGRSLRPQRTR